MGAQEAKAAISALLKRYERFQKEPSLLSNEKQACKSLIEPTIRSVLGWDVDDPSEFRVEESSVGKRIDYVVCHEGISQFIVEAKAPTRHIKDDVTAYEQALGYGYAKEHPFAILTNFHHWIILDCWAKVRHPREAALKVIDLTAASDEDLEILLLFSKGQWLAHGRQNPLHMLRGSKDRRAPIDTELLDDMKTWREQFLRSLRKYERENKIAWDDIEAVERAEEEVQRIIDRLVFIAYCEDKGLKDAKLKELLESKNGRHAMSPGWLWGKVRELFTQYDKDYDSSLFKPGRCDGYAVDDGVVLEVLRDLRAPRDHVAYNFASIEADILGRVYENFIGHVQTGKKRFTEKEDKGKRKKEGIYYTPKYIVDYIVNNTVRAAARGKPFEEILKLKVVDPACGSGSFLLRTFDVLCEEAARSLKKKAGELTEEERQRIMTSCIHGVDLDRRAVQIAELSLALRVAGRTRLPELSHNIRYGNSLIDDGAIAGLSAFDWKESFPAVFAQDGFDVVVGNPPYIRIQQLNENSPEQVAWMNKHYKSGGKGNYDIYVLFIELGLEILNPKGQLGFILPHKFFNAQYGAGIRGVISQGKHLSRVVHFGDQQVFDGATTYTCLLFLSKRGAKEITLTKVANLEAWREGRSSEDSIPASKITSAEWNFMTGAVGDLFEKLSRMPVKLGDVVEKIYQGLATSADAIYVLELKNTRNRHSILLSKTLENQEVEIESEVLHPLLKGSEISRYEHPIAKYLVLFPYKIFEKKAIPYTEVELKTKYPLCWNYLNRNKQALLN